MALLSGVTPGRCVAGAVSAVLLCAGCSTGLNGAVELTIYDAAVSCEQRPGAACLTALGHQPAAERLADQAFISRRVSHYSDREGYYLYFEAQRAGGVTAVLELDLPLSSRGAAADFEPRISYREFLAGDLRFESTAAAGRVEVPSSDDCRCKDGRLELRFASPGADGVPGTQDDEHRQLSAGHFGTSGEHCWPPRPLPLASPVEVVPTCSPPWTSPASSNDLPAPSSGGDSAGGGHLDIDVEGGCGGEEPEYYEEEAGCDADTTESSNEGCDGGDAGEGCDADGGGGCEGDAGAACEGGGDALSGCGDAAGGADCQLAGRGGLRSRRAQHALGLLLPWAAFALLHLHLRRRGGRSGRAGKGRPSSATCTTASLRRWR